MKQTGNKIEVLELQNGYKPSELGLIPEDWIECSFEDVMTGFSSGQTPYRAIERYYKGNIPWITSGELNYNVITDTIEKITSEAVTKTNLKIIPKGTFLFAITGLEAEGTRGSCAITGVEATTNQSCMALYPIKGKLTTDYLYQFYLKYGNWLAFRYCQGTKQQSFTGGIAKKLPIVLPPTTEEQSAIATALGDMDELISSLGTLIEKKKAIKQGAMQQLLTGKTRLVQPTKIGYKETEIGIIPEDWEEIQLGDLGDVKMCRRIFNYETSTEGGVPFYKIGTFGREPDAFISEKLYRSYRQKFSFPKKGDILISAAGTIGRTIVYKGEDAYFQDSNIVWIDNKEEIITNKFLYHVLQVVEYTTEGGTIQRLYNNILKSTKFACPTKEEQTEIATILSDMDREIAALEQNLSKYQLLKQGMMQELLTGKTRLV